MSQDKDIAKDSVLHDESLDTDAMEVIASDIHVSNQAVVDVAVVKNTATDESDKAKKNTKDNQDDQLGEDKETKIFAERVAEVLGDETAEKLVDTDDVQQAITEQADTLKQTAKDIKSEAKNKADSVRQTAKNVKEDAQEQVDNVKDTIDDVKGKAQELKDTASDKIAQAKDTAADKVAQVKDKAAKTADTLEESARSKLDEIKEETAQLTDTLADKAADIKDKADDKIADIKDKAEELKDTASDKVSDIKDNAQEQIDVAKDKAEELKDIASDKVSEVKETISNKVANIKETASETYENARSKAEEFVASIKDKVQGVKETADEKLTDAKQTAEDKLDEAKNKADELKQSASEETTSIQETIQEKWQAGKDELNAKKDELLTKKDELVEKATSFKDELQADLADESNAGLAGKLSVIGAYFASIYSTKENYEAVDLEQGEFDETLLRQQGQQIGQQLLGSKGVKAKNLASKVVPDDKMNALSQAVYGKLADWANTWAKSDLAKDERFDNIRSLDDNECEAFAEDIANRNRALVTIGGVSGLFGLKGVVADTAWLLMVSLKSIYQLSMVYDKPLTGKEGAKLAYGILSACNLDKLQEKQVIMTALALGDRVLKEAQNTSLSEELKKVGRKYQDRSYSKSLDELSKFVNLDRFNPKWLHYVMPVGSVAVSAHYNNELIEEVIGIAKATFANKQVKGLIEDKTNSLESSNLKLENEKQEGTDDKA